MTDAEFAEYWRTVEAQEVLAERIAFVITVIGLVAGTSYIIGHEILAFNPDSSHEVALAMAGWVAWSLVFMISGAYMALTLQTPSIQSLFRNATLRNQYNFDLKLLGATFILALGPSSLSLVCSPIDWLKPLFLLPFAMIGVAIIASIALGYHREAEVTVTALTKLRRLIR